MIRHADAPRSGANVPVLCVSAAGEKVVSQALRLGAKECLAKPVDFDELCERVAHYCEGPGER